MVDWLCFGWRKKRKYERGFKENSLSSKTPSVDLEANEVKTDVESEQKSPVTKDVSHGHTRPRVFNYRELATATRNFHPETLLGEGGFGTVYKGKLSTHEVVAVKKLNPTGLQGEKEFLVEVLMLSLLRHSNLVNMIGYCAEGTQRLLVLEFMPLGSLEAHLHDLPPDKQPLDWNTRMKIAAGAAEGVDYLHNQANPPVIYRDLKPSNILLDKGFHPKLSDFGLAKFGPVGDSSHVSTRVMGTHGYCAPEYALTGKLTAKSDTFSFGVVLLELISGRKAVYANPRGGRVSLVEWARPLLKDRKTHLLMADPRLNGQFSTSALHRAIEVAAMCLREDAHQRPTMGEVAEALKYLTSHKQHDHNHHIRRTASVGDVSADNVGPKETGKKVIASHEVDREQAVAEARMWGEQWREKRRQSQDNVGSDGLSSWGMKVHNEV